MAAKITQRQLFAITLGRAVQDYLRQVDPGPEVRKRIRWRSGDLDEVAKSAAIQVGLTYAADEVDPKVVKAIRALADSRATIDAQLEATQLAWEAYRKHFH